MLDLAFVRANLPLVEEKLRARNMDPAAVLGVSATLCVWNFPGQDPENTPAVAGGKPEPKAQRLKPPPEQEVLDRAATERFAESEAIHSVADSVDEVLLLVGGRRASRPPDIRHPFGHAGRVAFAFSGDLVIIRATGPAR